MCGSRDLDVQPDQTWNFPMDMEFKSCEKMNQERWVLQTLQPGFLTETNLCVF